jgi:hypothetical protein
MLGDGLLQYLDRKVDIVVATDRENQIDAARVSRGEIMDIISLETFPAGILPGHRTKAGTR